MTYYTVDVEAAIRLTLRFDLGWNPDEARSLAQALSEGVNNRLADFSQID